MLEVNRDNLLALIQQGMQKNKLGISGLEREAGVPKDTIRDFLRGKTQVLRADKLQKILRVLQPKATVTVSGVVGDDAIITTNPESEEVDCPSGFEPADVIAVRVQGDAMAPLFFDGWTIYYTLKADAAIPPVLGGLQVPYNAAKHKTSQVKADAYDALLGKPCIVELHDGTQMLRTLKKATRSGHYHLVGYNTSDIKDTKLAWAAKIIFIKPR